MHAAQALVDVGGAQRALQARLQQLAHQRAALVESKVQMQSRVLNLLGTEVQGACALLDNKAHETGSALHQLEALSSDLAAALCSRDGLGCELQSARAGWAVAQVLEQLAGKGADGSHSSGALRLGIAGGLCSPAAPFSTSPQPGCRNGNWPQPEQHAPPHQQPGFVHSSPVNGERVGQEAAVGQLVSTGSAGLEEGGAADERDQEFELELPSSHSSLHKLLQLMKLSSSVSPPQPPSAFRGQGPSRAAGEGSTAGAMVVHNGVSSSRNAATGSSSSSMKAKYQAALAGQRERHARELQVLQVQHREVLARQVGVCGIGGPGGSCGGCTTVTF